MRSVMHNFGRAPQVNIQRSTFRRPSGYKTTFNSGYLVPIYVDEVIPGDTHKMHATFFTRLATQVVPIMDNLHFDSFWFFVPNRLLWENFERLMGHKDNPDDDNDYLVPEVIFSATGVGEGTLGDYFGIPTKVANTHVNSLIFRAYNKIYNEWFRDQNLIDSVIENMDDGPDSPDDYALQKRAKRPDYFTSCLPWPQKGEAVDLPIGTSAPVYGNGKTLGLTDGQYAFGMKATEEIGSYYGHFNTSLYNVPTGTTSGSGSTIRTLRGIGVVPDGYESGLYADLTDATASTINELRMAFQLQKLLERDARGGTRYTEIIFSHFGVTNPDFRLQRPELLGTSSGVVNVTPLVQNSQTDVTAQGNLAGMATGQLQANWYKSFTEHGYIIGIINVWADLTYQKGLDKMWTRRDKFDFYWPELACIGEQEVYNREIYYQENANDNEIFGYQERFAEMRFMTSKITGLLRSNATSSLHNWHLSQNFGSLPLLNKSFIEEDVPLDRIISVEAESQFGSAEFILDAYYDLESSRPMPVFGIPGYIDHF